MAALHSPQGTSLPAKEKLVFRLCVVAQYHNGELGSSRAMEGISHLAPSCKRQGPSAYRFARGVDRELFREDGRQQRPETVNDVVGW